MLINFFWDTCRTWCQYKSCRYWSNPSKYALSDQSNDSNSRKVAQKLTTPNFSLILDQKWPKNIFFISLKNVFGPAVFCKCSYTPYTFIICDIRPILRLNLEKFGLEVKKPRFWPYLTPNYVNYAKTRMFQTMVSIQKV